ncbi:hypothetical protein [Neobacillus vireti]|uniref:hypothetical protein n=1 Tax=Neobacillus vireti TaxID=220686 RepID=UPI00300061ED
MKVFWDILFFIVIGYHCYKFIFILIKMNRNVVVPVTSEEIAFIRLRPQKTVDFPIYSNQKVGIVVYSAMLLFVIVMFIFGIFTNIFDWQFYLLLFLPLSYSHDLFNIFAVSEEGVFSGSRFVSWRRVKSFLFIPIDVNHKLYGYAAEVNNGYELIIKTKGFSIRCIVTSNEMKEKLTKILSEHV